ncbi:MAG: class I SAM-dependent methyltransferase [Cellvibrionaceae bacterium]
MISGGHSNRRAHNWLVYDISDRFLQRYSCHYRGTLYDLGAGESPYREFFLQYAKKYVAVDWSGSMHATQTDVLADLNEALPIESGAADTVVSLSVMEHLCDPQVMLNEAFRILKPGGRIVLQVPWQWWIHEAPHDFFRYTPYGLQYLFEKAGFVDLIVEPQAGYFTTATLKWNYFTRRFVRGPKPLRWLTTACLVPFWYIGQTIAPWLDKLDRNWALEASGFYVVARKP